MVMTYEKFKEIMETTHNPDFTNKDTNQFNFMVQLAGHDPYLILHSALDLLNSALHFMEKIGVYAEFMMENSDWTPDEVRT